MVSWGRSFIVALKIVIFSLVWAILGSVIASVLIFVVMPFMTYSINPSDPTTIIIAFLPITIIVGIISGLGIIATIVKFIVEESVNEVKQTVFPAASLSTPTFTPPSPSQMISESTRPVSIERVGEQRICPYCKAINPGDAKFCKVCGSRLL